MNIACSATDIIFEWAAIARGIPLSFKASTSIESYPTPCLETISKFLAFSIIFLEIFAVLTVIP